MSCISLFRVDFVGLIGSLFKRGHLANVNRLASCSLLFGGMALQCLVSQMHDQFAGPCGSSRKFATGWPVARCCSAAWRRRDQFAGPWGVGPQHVDGVPCAWLCTPRVPS